MRRGVWWSLLARLRWLVMTYPWIEPVLFLGLIYIGVWHVEVRRSSTLLILTPMFLILFPLGSTWLHRKDGRSIWIRPDEWRALGVRTDNLHESGREVLGLTLVCTVLIFLLGYASGWPTRFPTGTLMSVAMYLPWSFAQQYALQAFVYRRFRQILIPGLAALVAAIAFGAVHMPNPVLVVATTLSGFLWSYLYERHPNLLTLALAQAWLAVLVMAQIPSQLHHHMRVGPGFWSYH